MVQIQGTEYFKIAKDIDKDYYKNYLLAKKAGVQFLAYRCNIDTNSITIEKKLNISLFLQSPSRAFSNNKTNTIFRSTLTNMIFIITIKTKSIIIR